MPRRGRKPGKKQTGSIPVSAAPEMDIRTESLIQEAKDVQIPSSWAPITPVKPIPPIPQPICADRQKNQENWSAPEGFSTGLSQETQDHSTGEYCESTNSVHRNNRFHDWEEYLAKKSWVSGKGPICSELSIESDRLKNFPSANLRTHAAAARQGNVNGASSPGISNFNSQFQGNQFEGGSSTTAALGNRDISLGSNLRSNGSCALDTPLWRDMSLGSNLRSNGSCASDTLLYGDSIPYQPNYAPHSPPRAFTDTFLSRNITSQFAPITPDQSKKVDNKQAYDVHSLDVDERTNQAIHGNEVATARVDVEELHHDKEQQQLPKDGSSVVVSTQLDENHNPDKGDNLGIDLNITPQQKQRRRKHRPKVVKEGKPKRTPKPATPKPAGPKRKYVRKNPHNKTSGTPTAEVTSQSAEPKTAPHAAKSSRRKLDFELESKVREESSSCRPQSNINVESQAQNFYARVESKSTVLLGEGMEVTVEKTNVGVAYDLTNALNKEFEDYLSMPERQPQSPILQTPTTNDLLHENLKAYVQNERTRGKCRIVFSDVTHDKQGSTVQTNSQSAPSPNNSNCSSFTSLDEGEQARGLKRGNPSTNDEARPRHTNLIGGHYNSLHEYLALFPESVHNNNGIPGLHFPAIHKRRRCEKDQNSTILPLSTVTVAENNVRQATPTLWPLNNACVAPCTPEINSRFSTAQFNTSNTSTKTASLTDARGKQETFECAMVLDQKGRQARKRSKGPTWVCKLDSLIGIVGCRQLPAFPGEGAPTCGDMQGYEISHHPHAFMKALIADTGATMTAKKRTKRNQSLDKSTDAIQGRIPSLDEFVDQLNNLDINQESNQLTNQERSALFPYNLSYEEQNAIVLYQRGGTLVPFKGSFFPARKRRPRAKVNLDEETSRVWKLLLENINSEGIDGTDEEKARWWEEERRVFQGRADSFIARMHLVQGDRRFSPWKGSVVDSVVGVFLTQNVSDHLSSSAFMSLAARFPLKSNSNERPCFEETSILAKEPEVCILDPEDTIKWQWHEEKSHQTACNRSSMTLHDMNYNLEEVVHSNELLGSISGAEKSTANLKYKSSDISGNCPKIYDKSTAKREMDDVLSSQYSGGSSQNSVDSSMAQTAERIGSCLQDNSEADPAIRSNPNSHSGSSFLELLQSVELYSQCSGGSSQNSVDSSMAHTAERIGSCSQDNSEADLATRSSPTSLVGSSKASIRPIIPSSNYPLQMTPNSGILEVESFETLGEEILFSDISKKIEENCTSEHSGITAESVGQAMVQKVMTASSQEAPKSPSESNHACSSPQEEVNKIFQSQNRPVGNLKDNVQSQTQEHNCRMQRALEVPNLSREASDVTESTSVINNPKNNEHKEVESSLKDHGYLPSKAINGTSLDSSNVKRGRTAKQKQEPVDWDSLRLQAQAKGKRRERTAKTMDSLDWEAIRLADVKEVADTIKERGMNNVLAGRIKDFLNRMVREHGSIDLEWLRDVPPDKAKEYLLSIRGLGLKSVECVRLLTLHHLAFPVDTNVGRIAVRLGWVPLQPLPESLQLHLLELYPVLESIQRYLWPRLCKLDQRTLYELHYQMITFGKVFCTKSKPNCNVCPLRGECRHFASAFASARLALPGPEEKSIVNATENKAANQNPVEVLKPLQLFLPQADRQLQAQCQIRNCEPIIEVPASPEPIVEVPTTPEPEPQVPESDIEDAFFEDPEEIPMIKLNFEEFTQNLQNYMRQNMELQEGDMSKALVSLTPEAASIPTPKLKNVSQLRTEHQVYELPDSHPLLDGLDKREPDDPCSYLLAIWTPGETANSIQPPESKCSSQQFGKLCDENTCFSCNSIREANSQTVRGTLLIPCRTAMRGSFPLNGTYFQVNEVFADHESSINPIAVPRAWIWNLPRRMVYFGTSIPTIFKGLSTESIQYCFWRGFVCVRGFDQKTRAPRPLLARLHFPASKLAKAKGKTNVEQE
ncbi:protein ROS1A isoform X1 [Camellia sinensis]|uniref:protein ROS1A isoform X1 n=1 Tax=Camellia sinensis TaxID=4442 RepID=UPI001036DE06|nr:protein ROS1A isoform X1 [Camellia sinensis]